MNTHEISNNVSRIRKRQLVDFLESPARISFPKPVQPKLSVIMLLFNRAELTLACLKSIVSGFKPEWELIIIDNASTDDTPALLDRIDGARIIRNVENNQFIRGSNQGAGLARGEILLFLNNDTELFYKTIPQALKTLESNPKNGIVTCKSIMFDGRLMDAGMMISNMGHTYSYGREADPDHPMFNFEREVDYASGVFLMTPKKLFEECGMFDLRYAPAYYEDTDYSMKVRELGYRVVYDPECVLFHHLNASAVNLQAVGKLCALNRATFLERHRRYMEGKFSEGSTIRELAARHTDKRTPRHLIITDALPRNADDPRSQHVLKWINERTALGEYLTWFPLARDDRPLKELYRFIPRTVEVISNYGLASVHSFLAERKRYYTSMILEGDSAFSQMRRIIQGIQGFSNSTKWVYWQDADRTGDPISALPEAIVAHEIVRLNSRSGQQFQSNQRI